MFMRQSPRFFPASLGPALLVLLAALVVAGPLSAADLQLHPSQVRLDGNSPRQQLLVLQAGSGDAVDLTRSARFTTTTPAIVSVDERGVVRAVAQGEGRVRIECAGQALEAVVTVGEMPAEPPVDFQRDIQPVFTKLGCNSGPCHGKQRGQNGFQLSLLGFDSDFDFDALTKEARGRRIQPAAPADSLLIQKPVGAVPHGGGVRLRRDSDDYRMLLRWITSGAPRSVPNVPTLKGIEVFPTARVLKKEEQQQLVVTAHYSDGTTRDVTPLAQFQSNEGAVAAVDDAGLITGGSVTGEVAVMARYMDNFVVCRTSRPLDGDVPDDFYAALPRHNYIDEHVWTTLKRLKLQPSAPASDQTFLRRATIDIIGRIPTAEESQAFLADAAPDKRARLINRLLDDPEYAEHWANKWADLLRPNPYRVGIKATLNYDNWIRGAFRENRPYDQFVRELVTSEGSTFRDGHVTLFRDRREPDELTTIVSQLFLGIRLECAKCHHHPFEVWSQDDFYSFAAFFAKLGRKGTGLSPPISGSEEFVFTAKAGSVTHPRTGATMAPKVLFGETPPIGEGDDPRASLATWMTSRENPFFAQTQANRIWADLMGIGLVDPVDDLRATNPASNPPLLEALGNDFRDGGFDQKTLIRRITNSYVYGLGSLPNERNVVDTRNYSRYYRRRLRAEVLFDSVCQVTGVPENFEAMPPAAHSKSIWTHRIDSLFLDAFGRPDPNQDPPCERTSNTTIVQALHLMNARNLYGKVMGDESLPARLAKTEKPPAAIVEELYLAVYSRRPSEEELRIGTALYENPETNRRGATEDLLWALLNTPEFVFKD
ncbi:Bacterial Ig-like domain (group 2) [Planctomyces sp. SH-PL14]|nr:Bacterial Ig-like domain (group 2) [Planctomyces sp. SH-PL14]